MRKFTLFFTLLSILSLNLPAQSHHLMPVPRHAEWPDGQFRLDKQFTLTVSKSAPENLIAAADRFMRRLDGRTGLFLLQIESDFIRNDNLPKEANLDIQVERKGKLELGEEESYQLKVDADGITLTATTDFGAMHGLETLLQLLKADGEGYFFPAVQIEDEPRFPWRGLMIDVARHFEPMHVLKRNLDAMASVKLNVFHFHLTEDQGWRFESKKFPKLHEMGSDGLYYTQDEMRDLVAYAADRGIRVVPEFDVPGHSTALLVGYPELASAPGPYTIERKAGIMDPTLNPTIDATYDLLDTLFKEVTDIFPDVYFHIGGDENNGKQWDQNADIQAYMKANKIADNHALQTEFNRRILKTLTSYGKKMMGWDEILQPDLPKDAVIHSWRGKEALYAAAKDGYQAVLSNGYYIDLCKPTDHHYLNDPLPASMTADLTADQKARILGGEATMWGELVTPLTMDSRIWPRTAAIAERLWSPESVKDVDDMYRRLGVISLQLEELGLLHIASREMIMRKLCRGPHTEPLRVLLDVVEPLKGYERNPASKFYKMLSPMSLFADAAGPDAAGARIFRAQVQAYLANPTPENKAVIRAQLLAWRDNHAQLKPIIDRSPVLKEIEQLSANLALISGLSIAVIDEVRPYEDTMDAAFEAAKEQGGRTELMVVDAIQQLIKK